MGFPMQPSDVPGQPFLVIECRVPPVAPAAPCAKDTGHWALVKAVNAARGFWRLSGDLSPVLLPRLWLSRPHLPRCGCPAGTRVPTQ